MSADSGPGTREVAYRLFAAEFDDATVSYSESDEERAPNYVITPTGGRVNRLFLVGVLTETERVGGEQLRGRVVDPTGAFVAYAGQYQPDELAFLDRAEPPEFLAITGKARTFSPDDSDRVYTSARPESISEVDAETRDRWVVRTAEQTLDRVATMASALRSDLRGEELQERLVEAGVDPGLADGVGLAIEEYGTTSAYLQGLRETALDAVRVVAGERDEVGRFDLAPGEGGTEDAVLAGLASMDLGVTTAAPGVAAEEPAGDAGTSGPTAATGSDGMATGATEAGIESTSGAEPEPETVADRAGATEPPETTEPAGTTEPEPGFGTSTAAAGGGSESETEPNGTTGGTGSDEADSGTTEASGTAAETDSVEGRASDEPPTEDDEEFEDFEPGEFDLPEAEREEIEEEFGTDFETAGEVGPAGEADIGTPEPESEPEPSPTAAEETAGSSGDAGPATDPGSTAESEPSPGSTSTGTDAGAATEPEPESEAGVEPEPDAGSGPVAEPEPDSEAESASEAGTGAEEPEDEPEFDVDDVIVEVIGELDDGDGADREAVVETVVERHGADREAVAEAIEDAMMSGRAYEPSDGRLKGI